MFADKLGNVRKVLKLQMSQIGYLASRHCMIGGVKSVAHRACLTDTVRRAVMSESIS